MKVQRNGVKARMKAVRYTPVLLAIFICSSGRSATKDPRIAELFGAKLSILKNPTKVEAVRVSSMIWHENGNRHDDAPLGRFAGYPIQSQGVILDSKLTAAVSTALLDSKTYTWCPPNHGCGHLCGFSPGVALRIWGQPSDKPVELLVCFKCNDLAIVQDGSEKYLTQDFSDGRAKLLRLMKEIFLADPVIQGLKP